MEKVSVIVPIYNSEKTLKKCIESIISQTYSNIEIILVNDGSKDTSLNIMKEYKEKDSRIIMISQPNKGVSGARNTGIKNATGDYITFIDSDDYIEKDMLEETINIFKKYDCDVVRNNYKLAYKGGNVKFKDELEEEKNTLVEMKTQRNSIIKKVLLGKVQSYSWLLTIKSEIIKKNQLLFDEDILFMEDIVFLMRLLFVADNIFFYNEPKYYYYQSNNNSLTKNQTSYIKNMNNILIMKQRLIEILELNLNNQSDQYIKIINTIYTNALIGYLKISVIKQQDYEMILKELKRMRERSIVKEMIENINPDILISRYRVYISLFKKRRFNLLVKIFKIENILRKVKKHEQN